MAFPERFSLVLHLRDSAVADISKSEAFESDNDANGSQLLPQTKAIFSNMTVIGPRRPQIILETACFCAQPKSAVILLSPFSIPSLWDGLLDY